MKINEIKSNSKGFEIEGTIISKDKFVTAKGMTGAKCMFDDGENQIALMLWEPDDATFEVGNRIKIVNAYARESTDGIVSITKSKWGGVITLIQ